MALAISGIPMLTGDEALAFREKAEETLKKRGSIDFSKQRAEMKAILAKARFLSLYYGISCRQNGVFTIDKRNFGRNCFIFMWQ